MPAAPGRCGLVGNPTDMYGGTVISCSTQERASCTLTQDVDELTVTVSGQSAVMRSTDDLALRPGDYLNVARAALSALEVDPATTPPFHLSAATDIPMQAGLAGSTAILATLVGCLLAHLELRLNPYETAEVVRQIEYDFLGIVCGFQDHYMTVFGGLNCMDFRDKNSAQTQDADDAVCHRGTADALCRRPAAGAGPYRSPAPLRLRAYVPARTLAARAMPKSWRAIWKSPGWRGPASALCFPATGTGWPL